MRLRLNEAVRNAQNVGCARRFPDTDDPRVRDGVIVPKVFPRFSVRKGASLFTLGSCFTREIEEELHEFSLPTRRLIVPTSERAGRPNGILNEYNLGTMCQRVEHALNNTAFECEGIAPENDGLIDLLLADYVAPATEERLMQRRREVDDIYRALHQADMAIVALESVEAWFDNLEDVYLNRMPPGAFLLANRDRFEMHIMDYNETHRLLERVVQGLIAIGLQKIVVMVSPVCLETTYSGSDCTVANGYSKAVLVASATSVGRLYPQVEYFPSYEIALSAGIWSFQPDLLHVRQEITKMIAGVLVNAYCSGE